MGARRRWRLPKLQRGLVTSWLAPYSSPHTLSRPWATPLEERMDQRTAPWRFLTGRALTHTEEALAKAPEEKNHHPCSSGRRACWPVKGCTSTACLPAPRARHGAARAALACRATRRRRRRRRWRAGAMAPCARTMLLLLLLLPLWLLLLLLLQSGPGAERSVLMAGAASWGSVTSQPCCDLTARLRLRGDGFQALMERHWSTSRGAALPGRGARPVGQLHPRAGTQSHPGLSPQLCPVFRALSEGQRGAHSPPESRKPQPRDC